MCTSQVGAFSPSPNSLTIGLERHLRNSDSRIRVQDKARKLTMVEWLAKISIQIEVDADRKTWGCRLHWSKQKGKNWKAVIVPEDCCLVLRVCCRTPRESFKYNNIKQQQRIEPDMIYCIFISMVESWTYSRIWARYFAYLSCPLLCWANLSTTLVRKIWSVARSSLQIRLPPTLW